ncbi:LacI family DNA-binding transcriptional regulator [Cellulosilyticum sp. I15G10I2]|uniref:LacI family DNA-binding transcriptional regulator n=1 Tax=Cellulosilyticum sp. I15G10I2 TaxID=1892843 RepID=UPI00085CC10A|nr:LacI family DNA-binding transcriptional regulator [Cellulosilyticum sp. I15G10I2]
MANLKDVAKLARVDVSTVSRALNNTSYVHSETKKKIYAAVEQLGYKPNLIAKGLRQGKRHTLGVVVPGINFSIFGEIVQGIEMEARKLGYGVMICNTKDHPEAEEECLNRLRNGLVDGIIIASTGQNAQLLRDIMSSGIAIMQMVRKQDKTIGSVVADYYACGYEAVKYLAKKGCRNIGLINGSMNIIPYKERYKGYHKAMKEHELEEHVADSAWSKGNYFKGGYDATVQLLKEAPALDAIIVAVDMQGIGAIRALAERQIAIPEKVKVISLTGHSIGSVLETAMTSMEMPAWQMGEQVTKMIIESIEAEPENKPSLRHMVFEASLIERETT